MNENEVAVLQAVLDMALQLMQLENGPKTFVAAVRQVEEARKIINVKG